MIVTEEMLKEAIKPSNIVAWIETKDPDESYEVGDTSCCLMTQYFQSVFSCDVRSGAFFGTLYNSDGSLVGDQDLSCWFIASEGPITFGAALSRAKYLSQMKTDNLICSFENMERLRKGMKNSDRIRVD